ncbi:MAG: nucleotidyltransferase domain-containing protein [Phycisphaeraceae bacterium]|nr:nucleotidyltransferase domain-containing protein [Phycisphaeraceae bacterium]
MHIEPPLFNVRLKSLDTGIEVNSQLYFAERESMLRLGDRTKLILRGSFQFAEAGFEQLVPPLHAFECMVDASLLGDSDGCPRSVPMDSALGRCITEHVGPRIKVIDIRRNLRATQIAEAVRRVVEQADPRLVLLFGSSASTDVRPEGDIDLLIVVDGDPDSKLVDSLYASMKGIGASVDMVVLSEDQFERQRNIVGTVAYPAAKEGTVVYQRAA